ncbi:MAG: 2,3-diphosphoglycerate-dependent phosphoglycerate mutase [Bacilli bacterium]|jgi:2,3-bisphosphoglycerate-dependent phosphoglycerate mutase|nr:2,3-diphosphoglycerate-dependent phosphoglycerate mutase [Bacilli bacterium]MCH4229041.1 2,3-diphosphoglycerate-dependent phosphoglycerate mutase [Bacilli bacterium]MCH4277944.1 2,3-diphosphoglycerate-dependent phosphoglycerate mutase [Bacilli bacterium]
MVKLVLIRHGQSEWNLSNQFTGWTDVDLSENGVKEAHEAGLTLKKDGYSFDVAFSSVLKRANKTMEIVLGELGESNIEKHFSWRLNERHYGALQGLNKADSAKKWGDEQVHIWRRSADVQPPKLEKNDPRFPGNQEKYQNLVKEGEMKESDLPLTECLVDTAERVKPYFDEMIAPAIKAGKRVLIAAHGNSLRALVMELEHLSAQEIVSVEIPTGKPLVYELDEKSLKVLNKYYL